MENALHTNDIARSSGANSNEPLRHLTLSSLIGYAIVNLAGDSLERIKDIMVDIFESKIEYVVIEFGGFLGMNQKYLRCQCSY